MPKKGESVKRHNKGNSNDKSEEPPKTKQKSKAKGEKKPSSNEAMPGSEWSASEACAE